MSIPITVPSMGESISSAFLSAWNFSDGDIVKEGDELCELESDKATLPLTSPASGRLKISVKGDSEVSVGDTLAEIDDSVQPETENTADAKGTGSHKDDYAASPAARHIIEEKGIDPENIQGTGKRGMIRKQDLEGPQHNSGGRGHQDAEPPDEVKRTPMSRIRSRIAENLVRSRQESAHVTTFNEADLSNVMTLRNRYKEEFIDKYAVKLGFMSFFVKAVCAGIKEYPMVSAVLEANDLLTYRHANIGIAVSTDKGLVVPVLKKADTMSFAQIEKSIGDFAERARSRRIEIDELSGAHFTITNGGVFGSLLSTPIPTPGQTAVLGMHSIQKRPVAVEDKIEIRPMMYLALTYDHRVIDGREAVGFLSTVKRLIEHPERMLFEQ